LINRIKSDVEKLCSPGAPVPQNHGEFHLISQEIKKYDLSFVILIANRRGEQRSKSQN
jgi:hypothetical protein